MPKNTEMMLAMTAMPRKVGCAVGCARYHQIIAAAARPPPSMKGLRTRRASLARPAASSATTLAPQLQFSSAFARADVGAPAPVQQRVRARRREAEYFHQVDH